jgi:probable HAF family extracellular repeat protein
LIACPGLLFITSTCIAQMYTVTDLGTLGASSSNAWSEATAINASGQVVGNSSHPGFPSSSAFRTRPNSPINPATDDLEGVPCDPSGPFDPNCLGDVRAYGINDSGRVVGGLFVDFGVNDHLGFRTSPNSNINLSHDAFPFNESVATAINASGQAVVEFPWFASFRVAPNSSLNQATDNLGSLAPGGFDGIVGRTEGYGINDFGQVVGGSDTGSLGPFSPTFHAFRTAANKAISPADDDLGTLGGSFSYAYAINSFGQVVGTSGVAGDAASHAFRTASHLPIHAVTDDLGTLGAHPAAPPQSTTMARWPGGPRSRETPPSTLFSMKRACSMISINWFPLSPVAKLSAPLKIRNFRPISTMLVRSPPTASATVNSMPFSSLPFTRPSCGSPSTPMAAACSREKEE